MQHLVVSIVLTSQDRHCHPIKTRVHKCSVVSMTSLQEFPRITTDMYHVSICTTAYYKDATPTRLRYVQAFLN